MPELQAAIKRLVGNLGAHGRGDVFAFIGAKGGVGATTVAVNVATALAKRSPGSTLLIDLNVACGDAAVFLGAEPRFSVMDALENVQRLDAAFFSGLVVRTKSGLDLLGASGRPVHRPVRRGADPRRCSTSPARRPGSPCSTCRGPTPARSMRSRAPRRSCSSSTRSSPPSAAPAAWPPRCGSVTASSRLPLVLTRTDRRAEIGHEDVERTLGIDVAHTFPSDYRLALQAMNKGRPLVLDAQQRAVEGVHRLRARAGGHSAAKSEEQKRANRQPVRPPRSAKRA